MDYRRGHSSGLHGPISCPDNFSPPLPLWGTVSASSLLHDTSWQEKSASHLGLASIPGEARAEALRDGAEGSTFQRTFLRKSKGSLAKMIIFPGLFSDQLKNHLGCVSTLSPGVQVASCSDRTHPNLSPSGAQAPLVHCFCL